MVALYFVLSFALAWTVWIVGGVHYSDVTAVAVLGGWAPTISAVIVSIVSGGRPPLRELFGRLMKWRVHFGYYAFAILSTLGLVGLAAGIEALLGGSLPKLALIAQRFGLPGDQPLLFILVTPLIYLVTILGGPLAEELGWRGYAQPRLQARIGPTWAGLVIGIIWSLWHLPLFRFFPSAVASIPLHFYVPLVSLLGMLFAWLYNRTGGSVLLCILYHAGVNFALGGLGGHLAQQARGMTIVLILAAGLTLLLYLWKYPAETDLTGGEALPGTA